MSNAQIRVNDGASDQAKNGAVVILGAGPAGLACAYQLLASGIGRPVIVLDRAKLPGGAGASFRWKNHTLDYGPHAFHARGDAPEQLVRDLFKHEPDVLLARTKKVKVFLKGRFFKYPLQVKEAMLKFNPFVSLKIISEFLLTGVLHLLVSIPVESFEDWGRKRFGATLYRMSFGDYTRKVWKTDPNKISRKFAAEKIQGFSFINLVKKLLRIGGQVTEPYFQTVIYHRSGSGSLFLRLAERVREMGGVVELEADVKEIGMRDDSLTEVRYVKDGKEHVVPVGLLVNTIQLPAFIKLLGEAAPFISRHHAAKLRYVSLVLVFIEFAVERAGEDNWFYLLDKEFIFNRVTEQKNLSEFTMEPGKTVLSFELTCRMGDEYWQMTDPQLYELALADCRRVPQLAKLLPQATDFLVRRAPSVYEIYFKHFDNHAEVVLGYIQELRNAVTIGRRGLFLQGDMHQSVEMGLEMGKRLAANERASAPALGRLKADYVREYVRYLDDY
ncbi:MAG TPA: FAD-dependent oxidoreductase, partial [Usitatibacter sp.]|nr:FAD-dependent oxidoreductase [Usitatibacter sp.]